MGMIPMKMVIINAAAHDDFDVWWSLMMTMIKKVAMMIISCVSGDDSNESIEGDGDYKYKYTNYY